MCHLRSGFCPIFREIKTKRIKVIDFLIHQDNLILTPGLSHSTWYCTDAFLYWQYPGLGWFIRILNCLFCHLHPEVPLSLQLLAPYLVLVNAIPTTFVLTISSLTTYPNPFTLLLSAPIPSTATSHGLVILVFLLVIWDLDILYSSGMECEFTNSELLSFFSLFCQPPWYVQLLNLMPLLLLCQGLSARRTTIITWNGCHVTLSTKREICVRVPQAELIYKRTKLEICHEKNCLLSITVLIIHIW